MSCGQGCCTGRLQKVPELGAWVQVLREFCEGVFGADDASLNFSKPFCASPHNETHLPTGDDFNQAVFRLTAAGDGMVRTALPAHVF